MDTIDSYDAFKALQENWNELYNDDPEARFFLSWVWFSRVFLNHHDNWFILAARSGPAGTDYVGFFPLRLKTVWSKSQRRFRNEIHMAGSLFWGQYTGFICHPDWEREVLTAFSEHLKTLHWSRLSLRFFDATTRRATYFLSQFPPETFHFAEHQRLSNGGTVDTLVCPYVNLADDYETYLRTAVSANTRQKIRRFTRQFEQSAELRISLSDRGSLQRHLDILVQLWTAKWVPRRGSAAATVARKYRLIVEQMFEAGVLYMPVLWQGDAPLGVLACFVDWHKRSMYFFVAGRDDSCDRPFVGWLLHTQAIRWAIENGIQTYDFLHGDEAYKYHYGCRDRRIRFVVVKTRSGINLNGALDYACIDEVISNALRFIENGRLNDAMTACRQVRAVVRLCSSSNRQR